MNSAVEDFRVCRAKNDEEREKTYCHAFTIAFAVKGCSDIDGENITKEEYRDALVERIMKLTSDSDWREALGQPFDSIEEGD